MKRRDVLRIIRVRSLSEGKTYTLGEGGSHSKVTVGSTAVAVPRHSEIPTGTVRSIMRTLEKEFGKGWSGL